VNAFFVGESDEDSDKVNAFFVGGLFSPSDSELDELSMSAFLAPAFSGDCDRLVGLSRDDGEVMEDDSRAVNSERGSWDDEVRISGLFLVGDARPNKRLSLTLFVDDGPFLEPAGTLADGEFPEPAVCDAAAVITLRPSLDAAGTLANEEVFTERAVGAAAAAVLRLSVDAAGVAEVLPLVSPARASISDTSSSSDISP
jgi:hypothetical protein